MITVYILYSNSISKYYIGQTQDFEDRMIRHNSSRSLSTKNGIPWKLIWKTEVQSRSNAVLLESKIKGRGAKRFLSDIGLA